MSKGLAILVIAGAAAAFAYYVSERPMDLRVYYYGARGVFEGTRPMYGLSSGLGWPMHYRYPPLFLLLFAPIAALPLKIASAAWVTAKIAVLVWLILSMWRRGLRVDSARCESADEKDSSSLWYVVPILLIAPYIIEEFRYGNAQFFVVALSMYGLLVVRTRPALAGASLGLAIAMKVWPLFFLPYLAVRRDWKPVAWAVGSVVILALLPSVYFGWTENIDLLRQWFRQESQTQMGESEIWFPNQSLRGVLTRFLTVIDYSRGPDANYAQVHVATLDPATVRLFWMVLAVGTYAGFLLLSNRRRNSDGWLDHGLAFCLLGLLEPFTQKYAMAVLLWPALVSMGLMRNVRLRVLLCCAAGLALIQPLTPGAGGQRFLQVLGLDFGVTLLLSTALAICMTYATLKHRPLN